jgi:threonine/homoserine/homoserine lactone efflux protein
MLDVHALPLFLSAVFALLIVPGPDLLLISAQSVQRGARCGIACSVGVMLAGLLQTLLVSLGLGHAMESWPALASAIRWVGAAYLAYLGCRLLWAWRASADAGGPAAARAATAAPSLRSLVLIGLANNLLNPKALLFFALFLPQFTSPELGSQPLQLATLGLLLTFIAFGFNVLASFIFASLRSLRVDSPRLQRHGNGLVGALFVLLASRLAFGKAA